MKRTRNAIAIIFLFLSAACAGPPPAPAPPPPAVNSAPAADRLARAIGKSAAAEEEPAKPPAPALHGYCASRNSKVFHDCDCESVKRIKPDNLIRFPTREEAAASGRKPCKNCKP